MVGSNRRLNIVQIDKYSKQKKKIKENFFSSMPIR